MQSWRTFCLIPSRSRTQQVEHKKEYTDDQNLMFFYDLKENYCHTDARLEVNHLSNTQVGTSRVVFRPKNIEFELGSMVYVQTTGHGCKQSSPASVQYRGNFVQDIHPVREANDVLHLMSPRRKKKKISGGFRGMSDLETELLHRK